MDAIVLVSGLGIPLQESVADGPKPMAPVGGVPFLDILLERLLQHSVIERVVLSVGYKRDVVQAYFGDRAYNRKIVYAIEKSTLGTGGSIRNALAHTRSHEVLVVNGGILFEVDIAAMIASHRQHQANLTLALKPMRNLSHYNHYRAVCLNNEHRVISFEKKRTQAESLVNGGVYLLNQTLFDGLPTPLPHKFSFETDFLAAYLQPLKIYGFTSTGYFVDINIPDDYRRAQQELTKSSACA
jgi:D-glycero-alpha-D-manno-heptose 1-phosphate guanylyltransferase